MSEYRIVVTGGRDFVWTEDDEEWLVAALVGIDSGRGAYAMAHGNCRGADVWAAEVVERRLPGIDVVPFPARWSDRPRSKAGPERNLAMAYWVAGVPKPGRFCIAFPGGSGTASAVSHCLNYGATLLRREGER